ncbi:MAG: hypothetical protein RLY90_755 [Pseudomonadota bacterium]|jgi:hypothetical protein
MTINSAGSTSALTQQHEVMSAWLKQQKNIQELNKTLQAGDVPAAQNVIKNMVGSAATLAKNSPLGKINAALGNSDLATAQKIAVALTQNRASNPASAQAQAQNNQTAAVLSMQRGQGGQVNILA